MSEYGYLLANYRIEMDSPYNDGYTQLHYKELYNNLVKLGEREFTKKMLSGKIRDLEDKILKLTDELIEVKSVLSELENKTKNKI